jgi:dienelactone hydrolase
VREERTRLNGIPARVYEPDGATGLLLLGHGGGQSKDGERFVRLCRQYAAATGLAVVCIDAVDHGERSRGGATQDIPRAWHSSTAPRMADDWRTVAAALASIGPAKAYVGFSMGAMFGLFTVDAIADLRTAVLVVGGIPAGWVDDPTLRQSLLSAAGRLRDQRVLMINKTDDELFPAHGVHELHDAIATPHKTLRFWPGDHDGWPPDAIAASIEFITPRRA